ncbi:MAG TPA: hypothetical protein VEB66_15530 [Opitutaceae bacterium]|nr:hypothetical protein [Opitutaceae bacterium]
MPVQIEGVPDRAVVALLDVTGDWSFDGVRAWTSRAGTNQASFWREAVRRQLGFAAPGEPGGEALVDLPFSGPMSERSAREPVAFQARVKLGLAWGEIRAELPLGGGPAAVRHGAYTVSNLAVESERERPGVSLILTERSARGLQANSVMRPVASLSVLVNRRTREFFMPDGPRSGPEAGVILNQVKVASWRLEFPLAAMPSSLDELSVVVMHFGGRETIERGIDAATLTFVAGEPGSGTRMDD